MDENDKNIDALDPLLTLLESLHHREVMKQADVYARIHGWAAVYLSEKSPASNAALGDKEKLTNLVKTPLRPGAMIGKLQVYAGVRDVTVFSTDFLGNPTMYMIIQSVKQSHQENEVKFLVHPSRLLIVTPVPIRYGQVEGETALDPVWDPLVLRRNLEWAMAFSGIKYGGGMLLAQKETGGFSDEELAKVQAVLHRASTKQALTAPAGSKVDWIGPTSIVDYPGSISQIVKSISAGCGIPKTIFEGVEAGVMSGSQTNLQELYMTVSKNQEIYEPIYQTLSRFLMPTLEAIIDVAHFDWAFAFTQSAKEQADVELVKAQAMAAKLQVFSVNEVRKDEGAPDIEGGDIVLSIKSLESPMFGASVETEAPSRAKPDDKAKEEKKRDEDAVVQTPREKEILAFAHDSFGRDFQGFRELDAYLTASNGVTSFCDETGLGKGTYYDWRRKYS